MKRANLANIKALSYLSTYTNEGTVGLYRGVLRKYFTAIYGSDDLSQADKYVNEERDYETDVRTFFTTIKNKPPNSVRLHMSAIRTFLGENRIRVDDIVWKRLRRRVSGSGAITAVRVPSPEEFRNILSRLDIKGRALFLVLASSGMRSGETLKLKLTDVDLSSDPVRIDIKGEYAKNGNRRITFISAEATEALNLWLSIRVSYIVSSSKKAKGMLESRGLTLTEKSPDDDRLFPFTYRNSNSQWISAVEKVGLGQKNEVNHSTSSTEVMNMIN